MIVQNTFTPSPKSNLLTFDKFVLSQRKRRQNGLPEWCNCGVVPTCPPGPPGPPGAAGENGGIFVIYFNGFKNQVFKRTDILVLPVDHQLQAPAVRSFVIFLANAFDAPQLLALPGQTARQALPVLTEPLDFRVNL